MQSLLRVASVAHAEDFKAMNGSGIASRYPGDKDIVNDPAVIFADDFESYTSPNELTNNWDAAYQLPNIRIATEPNNVYSGYKSLEFSLPINANEVSNSAKKIINPTQDTVFIRAYTKFDPGYQVTGSNHNGLRLSAEYPGPGIPPPPDGTGFFLFTLQNNILGSPRPGESAPGFTHLYSGHGSGQRLATIGILPDSWFLLTAE